MTGKAGDQRKYDKWLERSGQRHIKCWWCHEPIGRKGDTPQVLLPDGRRSHEVCKPRKDDPIWRTV